MANKKLLTYEGLEEYNIKWHERLQAMTIDDEDIDTILFEELGIAPSFPEEWITTADGSLDLSLGKYFVYEPEGEGTKQILINNESLSNSLSFFLKLVDGGNFCLEWDSKIQWKDYFEPDFQAFQEDIILFRYIESDDVWLASVIQTTNITPYWKFTIDAKHNNKNLPYSVPEEYGMFCYMPFPTNELPSDATIDWGDGTVQTYSQFDSPSSQMSSGLPRHSYANEGLYHIKIQASTFENTYMVNYTSGDMFIRAEDVTFTSSQANIVSIDSPLPPVKGIWDDYGSQVHTSDNSLAGAFYDYDSLSSVPEKLFYNNPNLTSLEYALYRNQLASTDLVLYISSHNISNISNFISVLTDNNPIKTIYLPCNTTTHQTFKDGISTYGLELNCLYANTFRFTINTEATTTGNKKSAIPFNIYNNPNIILKVDWGDGTKSILDSSFYSTHTSNSSIHEYSSVGKYTITIYANNWSNIYMLGSFSNRTTDLENALTTFKQTLIEVNNGLLQLNGMMILGSNDAIELQPNSFYCLFRNYTKLQFIPSGLFDKNTAVTDFSYCFNDCSSLASIPSGLFDKNTVATSFYCTFYGCSSITSIPSGLFDKNTAVTSFSNCFRNCYSITSVPSGLFDKNTAVTLFDSCFQYCTSLQSIPSRLFDKNTAVTSFSYCFYNCTSITSIPSGLFDKNTAVNTFFCCFRDCTSLQSIPSGLFDKNTTATNFGYTFCYCSALASIPSGLFSKNTAVTYLYRTFDSCTSLGNFTLNVGSSLVNDAGGFVTKKDGTTRTIQVPANSTTYTKFNSIASSLGLTIVGV